MSDSEYYDILGLDRDADLSTIKRAYRRAAVRYHPDKNPGDSEAEGQFKKAAEAYAVLSDPEKRQIYDQFGKSGLGGQGGWRGFNEDVFADFGDILGDLFGFGSIFGGGRRRRGGGQAGRDLRYDLEIEFEEAVGGLDTQIRVPRRSVCETCDGRGAPEDGIESCSQCGGRGQVAYQQGFFTIARPCNRCGGKGRRITDPCETCEGSGQVRGESTLQLKIPAGVDDGTRLRMTGMGEGGTGGGPPGDLYVVLHVKEHPVFQRQGQELLLELPISFSQAALGAELRVPTIDGEETITVAPGTQSGTQLRLRGKGVPGVNGGQPGDQHVVLVVRTPQRPSAEARQLLEELGRLDGEEAIEPGLFDRVKNIFGS